MGNSRTLIGELLNERGATGGFAGNGQPTSAGGSMGDEYIPAGKECAGRSDCVPAPQVSGAGSVAFALALVAHAHADIHQEVEETFLVFQHLAPERRVVQRHGAMHQRPGSAIMEVRRNVLQLAVGDTLLDQLGQAFEVGGADLVRSSTISGTWLVFTTFSSRRSNRR